MHQERHVAVMRILIEMIDPRGVEGGRTPLDAVHGVTEAEQIFGEVSAVLSGYAGDQRHAPFGIGSRHGVSSCRPEALSTRPPPSLTQRRWEIRPIGGSVKAAYSAACRLSACG